MSLKQQHTVLVRVGEVFEDEEDVRLRQLGVKRELRKEFTNFSSLSFAIGIMGVAATIASTINTPILLGGRAVAIWSWFLGSFGCIAIAVSVAELVSAYPTSGGLYTSTAFVVPPKYRASVSFVNAWMTLIGQLACGSSVIFALSQMIFAAATIGTHGEFVATTGQTFGLYIALVILLGVFNSLPSKVLHKITRIYVYSNLLTTLAIMIAVPVVGRNRLAPSKVVWTGIEDGSGWGNNGFVLLLGLLCVQWVMTDYDAVAHISEEVKNAAVAAPMAIVTGVTFTAVLGFFLTISLCYGISDLGTLPGPTGLVFAQILWENLGRDGALVLWVCCIINQAMVSATCQLACIRSIYAISRDNALPDRKLFSKVWSKTQTPVLAVVLTVIISALLGLLSLASLIAINAVFSVTAVALDISYIIPIIAKVCTSLRGESSATFTPGPFYTGKWSIFINAYAIAWTCLETGVLIMPQVTPVTAATMNYAAPIIVTVCGLSWIWYKLYWHRFYLGPGAQDDIRYESSPTESSYTGTGKQIFLDEEKTNVV